LFQIVIMSEVFNRLLRYLPQNRPI